MKTPLRGFAPSLSGAALIAFAAFAGPNCQPSGGTLPGSGGNSGNSGNGGSNISNPNGGSSTSSGGSVAGGSPSVGGSSSANGGSSSSSSNGSGGTSSASTTSSGNGGATGAGGSSTVSGGGSTGTSSGSGPSGTAVTISTGKGVGAMVGYGWVSLGSEDTISSPECGTAAITSATSCAATTWSTTSSLCVSGSIPALPATPAATDYADNWGLEVGLNATSASPQTSGLGQSFKTVTIAVTGTPTTGLRAQVHLNGDPAATTYCYTYSTGAMPLASFAQDCYNTTPTELISASKLSTIDQVMVQVPSAAAAITVTNLCITGITFGS
ncbi:MAG: hypothetical protein ABSB49_01075 [Polyangia bacterium]